MPTATPATTSVRKWTPSTTLLSATSTAKPAQTTTANERRQPRSRCHASSAAIVASAALSTAWPEGKEYLPGWKSSENLELTGSTYCTFSAGGPRRTTFLTNISATRAATGHRSGKHSGTSRTGATQPAGTRTPTWRAAWAVTTSRISAATARAWADGGLCRRIASPTARGGRSRRATTSQAELGSCSTAV